MRVSAIYPSRQFTTGQRQIVPFAPVPSQDGVRFEGLFRKSGFTAAEVESLAKTILQDTPNIPLAQAKAAIASDRPLPVEGEWVYGVVYPDGKRKSPHSKFDKLADYMVRHLPKEAIPQAGLPLVWKIRGPETFQAVKHFLEADVIPNFQLNADVQIPGQEATHVLETVSWPFFENLISGEALPDSFKPLVDKLHQLPVYQLKTPALSPAQDQAVQEAYAKVHTRLAAIEVARMQYSDRVNIKEVVGSLVKGALVGGLGETGIHYLTHDGGTAAWAMRSGLLVVVDAIDNVYGEMGVLHSDLEANGMHMSKETIFGKKTWWEILKNKFSFAGPGGIFAKRAAQSAVSGAMTGAALAVPVGMTLSSPEASVAARTLVGGPGTLGTATAIPFNIRATLPQVYLTTRYLIQTGKIPLPTDVGSDPQKVHQYAHKLAEQEMLSRLGFNASMKAFSLVPLSGALLASEAIGVPREVAQIIFMGLAPAMENVLRLMITLTQLKWTNPQKMNKVETMILDSADRSFNPPEKQRLAAKFADAWTHAVCKAMTVFPFKVKLPTLPNLSFTFTPKTPDTPDPKAP